MISIIVDDTKCNIYKQTQYTVIDEGTALDKVFDHTVDECKTKCSDIKKCKSFRYCPNGNKCFFKDKMVSESSPIETKSVCFTVYQNCENGM